MRTDGRTNGRKGRQTDMTKKEVVFRNFAKSALNSGIHRQCNPVQKTCLCNLQTVLAASSNNLPNTIRPTRRKLVSNRDDDSFFLLRKLLRHQKLHSVLLRPRKHYMSYR